MSHDNSRWVIMTMTAINAGDIMDGDVVIGNTFVASAIQTSKETLRKNIAGDKAILKWDGDTPDCFDGMTTLNHSEIRIELAKNTWTRPEAD